MDVLGCFIGLSLGVIMVARRRMSDLKTLGCAVIPSMSKPDEGHVTNQDRIHSNRKMFETGDFRINELGVQLLKAGIVYRSIDFIEIQTFEFKYGAQTKYPIRTLLFGLTLVGVPNLIWYFLGPINFPFPTDYPRVQIGGMIAYLFMVLMGIAAMYLVIARRKILVLKLNDGSSEILQLKKLNKENRIPKLIEFLKGRVTEGYLL